MRIGEAVRLRQKRIVWIDEEIERRTIAAQKLADVKGLIPEPNRKKIDEIFQHVHALRMERRELVIIENSPLDVLEALASWDDVELAYLVNDLGYQELHEVVVMGGRLIELCRDRLDKASTKIRKEIDDPQD